MQTEEAKHEEKVPHTDHSGGDGGAEHRCWRCTLKRAVLLGSFTAVHYYFRRMTPDLLQNEDFIRYAKSTVLSGPGGSKARQALRSGTNAIHETVVWLDGLLEERGTDC